MIGAPAIEPDRGASGRLNGRSIAAGYRGLLSWWAPAMPGGDGTTVGRPGRAPIGKDAHSRRRRSLGTAAEATVRLAILSAPDLAKGSLKLVGRNRGRVKRKDEGPDRCETAD